MAIKNKLIHFKTKENFMSENGVNNNPETPNLIPGIDGTEYGQIKETSIVFIKDSKEIWTHGNLYKSVNWSVLKLPKAGDIAYWDGSKVKTVSQENWNSSLGIPVGVIVVPTGFAPDGKARMVSLKYATSAGTSSDSAVSLKWGPTGTDTTLTNYTRVPTTNNVGSTTTGSAAYGYLPSDNFSGTASVIDPEAKYASSTPYIPSPYLNGAANPDYYGAIDRYNNALSDFNGSGNTATLVGLGSDYAAANAANNYSDGVSGAKWYLPAMGELGYLIPRFKEINKAIAAAGGVALPSLHLWSSTEYGSDRACYLIAYDCGVYSNNKTSTRYVRPFAIVE